PGSFLDARAQELVNGGLMALLIPTVPSFWDPQTEYTLTCYLNLMGSCLIDMAKKGIIDEAKADAFNLPYYLATPEELKTIIDNNNNYSIERLEILNNPGKHTLPSVSARAAFFRAGMEKLIGDHFGSEIIEEFFDLLWKALRKRHRQWPLSLEGERTNLPWKRQHTSPNSARSPWWSLSVVAVGVVPPRRSLNVAAAMTSKTRTGQICLGNVSTRVRILPDRHGGH
ncbi:hypothetical protein RD792_007724, partial [Penstemon davidsonii]